MITGRWGKPTEVLLDITVDADGTVRGIVNPGSQNVDIERGHFNSDTGALQLEGRHFHPDGRVIPFEVAGRLAGRTLHLSYKYGSMEGDTEVVRVEEYVPPRRTLLDRLNIHGVVADVLRFINSLSRPSGKTNAALLRARGESLDSIILRHATTADIPALAQLHVTTWNATYRTSRGPSVATRESQWRKVFANEARRDFLLVLENRNRELIGFAWGIPNDGVFQGQLSKIYLRWEYHGLGLGTRMLQECARQFIERGIHSFILFSERSNPTQRFYDRMGGERLLDDRGRFTGAFGWRDVHSLIPDRPAP